MFKISSLASAFWHSRTPLASPKQGVRPFFAPFYPVFAGLTGTVPTGIGHLTYTAELSVASVLQPL